MAPRAPGVHTHEEWKGMAQPVGLVVEPVVLNRLGVFPESATTVLADWQQRLEQLLEDQPVGEQWLSVAPSFELFCQEVLAWEPGDLRKPEELAASVAVILDDYDEVLRPDWVVPEPSKGDGPLKAQLLVQELPLGALFDALPNGADGRRSWEATPQQRLERLLKESEHPIGLLWNGVALRMVYAPRGESSGHLTFPLEPMTTVDGRPMLAAVQMLLGPDRLFEGGASYTRLRPLMEQSRKEQSEVSTRLAEQVLEALWILLRGFDAAGLEVEDPSHIYGGLITVLLRLVFLLYAEDEELMPTDSLYGQHYSVGGLAQRLRQDRSDYQNAMEGRRGAWATLLSLFRLVYDGGGSTEAYLPARHGDLFDPDTYPFLEGRTADTAYTDGPLASVPTISDDVVEQVLTKLLVLDGQILSYRALDVEQIGSVYEGIMGFMVEKATGPSVGITYRPPRQKITITVVVDANQLLTQPGNKREKCLDDHAGVALKLPAKAKQGLKDATSLPELCITLGTRLSPHTPRGLIAGSLILQPTAERRRSGSHYTPRALTEPIVAEAFRPWLERCHHRPTAEQILALKVCDPAMGSGAFLVAVCRFLAGWLVEAWERDGYPEGFRQEWDKDNYARRLVAQSCLYGVDKNPFAVNLAKLSLWLVTLSQELPFTFVDHALKCGDSLVGVSLKEINSATEAVQLLLLRDQRGTYVQACADMRSGFSKDTLSDEDYDRKSIQLRRQIKATDRLRQAGDLMVAGFFDADNANERADKKGVYLAMLSGAFKDDAMQDSIQEIRDRLASGDKGIHPFHWDLEFPEVFNEGRDGFDVFVGNPPYLGGNKIYPILGENYNAWTKEVHKNSGGKAVDLVAHFFRRSFYHLRQHGTLSFLATSTVAEGDTRIAGLKQIREEGGLIYKATRRLPWPGMAAVTVSVVHITRSDGCISSAQSNFNSHLIPTSHELEATPLRENANRAFRGCVVYGAGFIFSDEATDDNAGTPEEAAELVAAHKEYGEFILPLMGGKEINSLPQIAPRRRVICFRDLSLNEAERYPELISILSDKVRPMRESIAGTYSIALRRKEYWWQFGTYTPALCEATKNSQSCIGISRVTTYICFRILPTRFIFTEGVIAISSDKAYKDLAILSSQLHMLWAEKLGGTQDARHVYTPEECFQAFPQPLVLLEEDPDSDDLSVLSSLGRRLDMERQELMETLGTGLTDVYNNFHDPSIDSSEINALRQLHRDIDLLVLELYGWSDVANFNVFAMHCFDPAEDDFHIPEEIQERIASSNLQFYSSDEASEFQGSYLSAIKSHKKLPWRYRWPEAVRDDVLARLLALNAERYEEEVNLGLHSKGAKQAARATSKRKTKSSSSAEFQLTSEPYQTGLQLF